MGTLTKCDPSTGLPIETTIINGATVELIPFADEDISGLFNSVAHSVGDIVHIKKRDWPAGAGTYVVNKINRTTYDLIPEGEGRPVRSQKDMTFAGPSTEAIPPRPTTLGVGVPVTVKNRGEQVWIVVKATDGKHNLYPLGGATDGRYLRSVPSSMLTVLTEVLWEATV